MAVDEEPLRSRMFYHEVPTKHWLVNCMKNLNPVAYFIILLCAKVKWAREIPRDMADLELDYDEIIDGFKISMPGWLIGI